MKFLVGRTSLAFHENNKPCEGAYYDSYIHIDERTVDDPAKIGPTIGRSEWWYSRGTNHRIEDGHIKRDVEDKRWFVDIDSLEDLLDFVSRNSRSIVLSTFDFPEIEIYDDYRE